MNGCMDIMTTIPRFQGVSAEHYLFTSDKRDFANVDQPLN